MLVLRTCNADLTSHGGYQWPASGEASAPDWSPIAECGHGLHGLPWGEGDGGLLDWSDEAKWLVVDVPDETVVVIGRKVKFPRGNVVHCGTRESATSYLAANGGASRNIVGYTATAGDRGTATAGYGGTATAGECGLIQIAYWDDRAYCRRIKLGYIGEGGLLAGVNYRLDDHREFVAVGQVGA